MKAFIPTKVRITGTLVAYFVLCRRKAWLFYWGIGLERESELVALGRWLSEEAYPKERHEINIDNQIVMDWVDSYNKVIHEVKRSRSAEQAHRWQVKYYLYYLKRKGLDGFRGMLHYPLLRRTEEVHLNEADIEQIERCIEEIARLVQQSKPPVAERKPLCRHCAYFSFCWV